MVSIPPEVAHGFQCVSDTEAVVINCPTETYNYDNPDEHRLRVDEGSMVEFKVVVEPGAKILASTIRGPAIIGPEAIVENSYIGPFTSIDRGVRIINSEVEHSIVLEGSVIEDIPVRIADSLIGRDVVVAKSPAKPKVYRFMLGDASRVGIL